MSSRQLLLVDDDPTLRRSITLLLESRGWVVTAAPDGRSGVMEYERQRPDLVLSDLDMPGLTGIQLLDVIRQRDPDATIVLLTAYGDVPTAVEAMQLGAENFLTKPIEPPQLLAVLERAWEKSVLRRRSRWFADRQAEVPGLSALGQSPRMQETASMLRAIADGDAPVLLLGETGTGKGWAARMIHSISPRARAPFVELNCASLNATFLESELFGHEKGAFTDAKTQKRGLFEIAHGGTLFLDEIGELAPELQAKLLTALETGRFRRLGGTHELEVDVRVVAATNVDLEAAVAAGRFRSDLFYRLNVLPLSLPPLRDRDRDDVAELAFRILAELRGRVARGPRTISPEAMLLLLRYAWPGNIRQLRNVLERVLILSRDADEVRPEHLPPELHQGAPPSSGAAAPVAGEDLSLAALERAHIERVLERFEGNRSLAARALGITRGTLYKRMREFGLASVGRR